jgi:hypothetical protein
MGDYKPPAADRLVNYDIVGYAPAGYLVAKPDGRRQFAPGRIGGIELNITAQSRHSIIEHCFVIHDCTSAIDVA